MPVGSDEQRLIDDIVQSDQPERASAALGALLKRYQGLVYAIALDLTADRSLADDVFQETFVRLAVWLRKNPGADIRSFARLLAAFVRRTALELGRSGRKFAPLMDLAVSSPVVQRIYARELLSAVPPQARRVLELTLLDGLSSQEVAKVLDLSAENVRVIKHRALRVIRQEQARDLAGLAGGDSL
jgi:RNA polymerase sigma-70 factor (ECF subfamily)